LDNRREEIFLFIARSDKRSVALSYVSAKRRSYGQKEPFSISIFKDFLGAADWSERSFVYIEELYLRTKQVLSRHQKDPISHYSWAN